MTAKLNAMKVKELVQSGNWKLLVPALSQKTGEKEVFAQECCHIKLPKMPPSLEILFPKLAKKIQERRKQRSIALWKQQEKELPSECFSALIAIENSLSPSRIQRWRAKDYCHFARQIQKFGKQEEPAHPHQITWIHGDAIESSAKDPQDALWEEMIKGKEERHYRIGDVTNYFS